jgi:hypothetical protein
MPDGNVIVTGGSRENNGNGGYVTNAEIWHPDTGEWTVVEVPYEHARLYHSIALLLPDGRIMVGGGGTPGPRNYTDVEFYSPAYLFDGDEPATRPVITDVPKKVGYDGTFTVTSDSTIDRVTLVRNGSVTHGFNNDQNFQDLSFTQSGGTVTITSPANANLAPPGAYMVFLWDEDGTPSVADIVQVDPTVRMDSPAPKVVDQFEYPRLPVGWQSNNVPASFDVAPGDGRMSPWEVDSQVQLIRAAQPSMGGLGLTGYHLAVGADGDLTRTIRGLDVGREYRLSIRYARDSRSTGTAPGTASLSIGGLSATLSAGTDLSSQNAFGTYTGTFTADARRMPLTVTGGGGPARPRPLRVRGGHRHVGGQHRHRRHGRTGDAHRHHRLEQQRDRRQRPRPPGGQQRQHGLPAGRPAAGRVGVHHLVLGPPRHQGQLDQPVPHR